MKKIPDRIYLQIRDEIGEKLDMEEITWCSVRIEETDIEYIRVKKRKEATNVREISTE